MLYQNDLKPLVVPTTSQAFAIYATVKADNVPLGTLSAFPMLNSCKYYYDSILRRLKIQEELPDFDTPIRISMPNIRIETTVDGQTITDILTCGTTFPTSNRLTNNQKRTTLDSPYQGVYFTNKNISTRLYGKVNNGASIDLGLINTAGITSKGAFIIINYHKFYAELGANEYDVVNFHFDNFFESIKLDAIYTDFPFNLVMRNQYGFWDCFRLFGNQEDTLEFQNNSMETYTEVRTVYNETTDKVSVQTGLLEIKEKEIIAENLRNLDFFEYRNNTLFRLISDMKNINKRNLKEAQDTLKLDFKYSTITRRFL